MDRLKVLCFAGTYGLALVCELARLVVRSPFRWYLTVGLTSLGWLVQTVYLANLALKDQIILPVTSAFESVMVLAWIVAFIGLFLMLHWPRQVAVGIFVLPLVLGLVVVAGWFVPRESDWLEKGMMAFWGTVHGIFLLGGAVCTCVAFAAGLMYLAQMRRLKSKSPGTIGTYPAESRAVRASQSRGHHHRLSPAHVRAPDRHDPECEDPEPRARNGVHPELD